MFNKSLVFIFVIGTILYADNIGNTAFAGKRIAILYEKGKNPEDWYKTTFDISKKFVESGEIVSTEMVQEGDKAGLIRFLVHTDSLTAAMNERKLALSSVGDKFKSQGLPITYHYVSFPENKFFGDKRIGYIVNRFESCYYEPFLINGLVNQGAIIVKENENPDATLTIGVDACMSGWELEYYLKEKYNGESTYITSINREAGIPVKVSHKSNPSGFGSDLMRSGSSLQLSNTSNGTAGLAIAGVGLALELFERSVSNKETGVQNIDLKSGMAIDLVRYHITLEGKGQEKVAFYHTYTGTTQHDKYGAIANDTFVYPMQMLYLHIANWMRNSRAMKSGLQSHQKESDLLKALRILHEN